MDDIKNFNVIIVAVPDYMKLINKIVYIYNNNNNIRVVSNNNKFVIFNRSYFSIAVSGTITLELALHKVPFFTVYRLNYFSFYILKILVTTKFVTLVNIIFDRLIVNELIQKDFNIENIRINTLNLINNKEYLDYQIKQFSRLPDMLTNNGNTPSKYAASLIDKIIF